MQTLKNSNFDKPYSCTNVLFSMCILSKKNWIIKLLTWLHTIINKLLRLSHTILLRKFYTYTHCLLLKCTNVETFFLTIWESTRKCWYLEYNEIPILKENLSTAFMLSIHPFLFFFFSLKWTKFKLTLGLWSFLKIQKRICGDIPNLKRFLSQTVKWVRKTQALIQSVINIRPASKSNPWRKIVFSILTTLMSRGIFAD